MSFFRYRKAFYYLCASLPMFGQIYSGVLLDVGKPAPFEISPPFNHSDTTESAARYVYWLMSVDGLGVFSDESGFKLWSDNTMDVHASNTFTSTSCGLCSNFLVNAKKAGMISVICAPKTVALSAKSKLHKKALYKKGKKKTPLTQNKCEMRCHANFVVDVVQNKETGEKSLGTHLDGTAKPEDPKETVDIAEASSSEPHESFVFSSDTHDLLETVSVSYSILFEPYKYVRKLNENIRADIGRYNRLELLPDDVFGASTNLFWISRATPYILMRVRFHTSTKDSFVNNKVVAFLNNMIQHIAILQDDPTIVTSLIAQESSGDEPNGEGISDADIVDASLNTPTDNTSEIEPTTGDPSDNADAPTDESSETGPITDDSSDNSDVVDGNPDTPTGDSPETEPTTDNPSDNSDVVDGNPDTPTDDASETAPITDDFSDNSDVVDGNPDTPTGDSSETEPITDASSDNSEAT